jgi:hypothetical protein
MTTHTLTLDIVHRDDATGKWAGHLWLEAAGDYVQVSGDDESGLFSLPDWQTDDMLREHYTDRRDGTEPTGPEALVRGFAARHHLSGTARINDETGWIGSADITL